MKIPLLQNRAVRRHVLIPICDPSALFVGQAVWRKSCKRTFFVMTKLVPKAKVNEKFQSASPSASHVPIAIVDKMAKISPTYLQSEDGPSQNYFMARNNDRKQATTG